MVHIDLVCCYDISINGVPVKTHVVYTMDCDDDAGDGADTDADDFNDDGAVADDDGGKDADADYANDDAYNMLTMFLWESCVGA